MLRRIGRSCGVLSAIAGRYSRMVLLGAVAGCAAYASSVHVASDGRGKQVAVSTDLPALRIGCTTDDQCAYVYTALAGSDTCCNSNTLVVAAKDWISELGQACETGPKPDCSHIPPKSPNSLIPTVSCMAGRCTQSGNMMLANCETDDDCSFTYRQVEGEQECCPTLDLVTVGHKAWIGDMEKRCEQALPSKCAPVAGPSASRPDPVVGCTRGHCERIR